MAIKKINTDLQIEAGLRDGDGDLGTNNQVLISTGTGINWIDGSGTGIIGGPYLPLAGGTMTGTNGVVLPDNFKLNLGNSSDLQIYHDGSNSYIKDTGTGNLRIDATNFFVRNSDGSKLAIDAVDGAEVNLRYNGSKKFETTSTGVTVTGAATATTFSGDLNGTINTATTAVTKPNATDDSTVATTAFVQNLIETIPAGLVFQGTWNAATNTPTLANGTGTTGHFYIVSTEGSTNLDGITDWKVGDWAVFVEQGATDAWEKVDNSSVLDGSGTGNQITKWAGSGTSNTLTNSIITDDGTNVEVDGTFTATGNSTIQGRTNLQKDLIIRGTDTLANQGAARFYVDSSNKLFIDTANDGSDLVTIDSSGNVGIGTTVPSEKLDVAGNINTSGTLKGPALFEILSQYANRGRITLSSSTSTGANQISLLTDGNVRMVVNKEGNVGIGTTAPAAKLHVEGGFVSGASTTSGLYFNPANDRLYISNQTVLEKSGASLFLGYNTNQLIFRTNNLERARFDVNGNFGIGTTSPSSKLQVSADNGDGITLQHGASNAFYILRSGNDDTVIKQTRNYTSKISISTLADSGTHESSGLNIVGQGVGLKSNIGIGTNSPSEKLDVEGNIRVGVNNGFYITNQNVGIKRVANDLVVGGFGGIRFTSSSTTVPNQAERMRITSAGDVGIGTTSPGQKLDVAGSIRTNNQLTIYNSDLSKQSLRIKSEATTNTGLFKLSNGSNWGLLMKGHSNGPFIGSYFNGSLNITGFEDSEGTTPSAIRLAEFVFGGTGGGSGHLTLNGDLRVNTNKKIQFGYANSQTNGIEWATGSKISAAITPVDTANYSRTGLGFFTGDFSDGTTNADERMRITRAGNVGIGTTSPSEKLEVSGNVKLNGDHRHIYFGGNNTFIGERSNSTELELRGGGSTTAQTVYIDNTGQIGAGTSTPNSKLDIRRAGSGVALELIQTSGAPNDFIDLKMIAGNATAGTLGTILRHKRDGAGGGDFSILTNPTLTGTPTEKLTVKSDGNVGIGTASPARKLQVSYSSTTAPGFSIKNTNTTVDNNVVMAFNRDNSDSLGWTQGIDSGDNSFKISEDGDNLETNPRIVILSGGNVGIGTTSPSHKLTVPSGTNGRVAQFGNLEITTQAATYTGSSIEVTGTNSFIKYNSTLGHKFFTRTSGGGNTLEALTILPDTGNVGIGTASPAYILDVVSPGSATARLRSAGTGAISLRYENGGGFKSAVVVDNNGLYRLDATNISLNPTNNVGIGTTTPSQLLHVAGNIRVTGEYYDSNNSSGTTGQILSATLTGTDWIDNAHIPSPTPTTPGSIVSTIVGQTIEIAFNQSATANIDYYQVWSSDDGGDYGIIAQIPPADFSATMTVVDTSFSTGGTMSYRVYAVKSGVYSSPGTTSKTYTVGTLDVTDMTVINLNTAYYIQYEKPASRFIDHIEIYMDSQTTQGALNRSNASIIYSGQNTSFMKSVGVSNNFHQFWVEVVTT